MRRFRLVLPVAVLLIAVACTGGSSDDGSSGGSSTGASTSSGPVQLTMWIGYTPPPPSNQSF